MHYALALSLLLLTFPSAASDLVKTVPSQFRGTWSSSLSSCDTGTDDMVIELSSDRITHWESSGPLRAIVLRGKHELALIAELSDEGQTWLTTKTYKLTPKGDKLIDTTVRGEQFVRYRCPGGR